MGKSEDEKACLVYLRKNPESSITAAFLAGRADLAAEIAKLREQRWRLIELLKKSNDAIRIWVSHNEDPSFEEEQLNNEIDEIISAIESESASPDGGE